MTACLPSLSLYACAARALVTLHMGGVFCIIIGVAWRRYGLLTVAHGSLIYVRHSTALVDVVPAYALRGHYRVLAIAASTFGARHSTVPGPMNMKCDTLVSVTCLRLLFGLL